ncbi:RpiR family transcriptional regulator [Bacillus safensis]|uniref:MurR/RpiR family transcriptional regulator n=1 Tax=Bacillus safensis TaxID=561879 RepID=UPI000650ABE2|nr:MurR/RpiR family transcriptional regulator [Bacillus safensis]KML10687.1 RpiR family transcriptional regulator [Bacillus safensis]KML47976.1 RpiR family transcriptional regulator [Bacillus safensis]KMN77257.1 RpiR family transcriptional regulator [Bacillus safensis]USD84495.1 MurR/RpiR family transcriptional regulator [Bacillus safensis]
MENVYKHIAEQMPTMSKSNLRIAKYILENPNTVPFLTGDKLAKITGVSPATIVRFSTFLGYSGYPELQQYMQSSAQQQLTTTERLKISKEVYNEQDQSVYDIFLDDISNIRSTLDKLDIEAFKNAVESLIKAKRVYIVANRSATALGVFLQYYLQFLLEQVELIHSIENVSERIFDLNEDDVVIGISFARYTKSTLKVLSYAKEKEATTVAITDNLLSPLIPYADIPLTASSQMPTFIDSFVAPLSLINALIVTVGKEKEENFQDKLESLEEIWDKFNIFHKN